MLDDMFDAVPKRHPTELHLCIAIVQYKTRLKALRKGICTTWLANLPLGMGIDSEPAIDSQNSPLRFQTERRVSKGNNAAPSGPINAYRLHRTGYRCRANALAH